VNHTNQFKYQSIHFHPSKWYDIVMTESPLTLSVGQSSWCFLQRWKMGKVRTSIARDN
jgi:hypothetical protein